MHGEMGDFEIRASEVTSPHPAGRVTGAANIEGEPEPRDPGRLVRTLDVRPA
jgi:hypothetical protein